MRIHTVWFAIGCDCFDVSPCKAVVLRPCISLTPRHQPGQVRLALRSVSGLPASSGHIITPQDGGRVSMYVSYAMCAVCTQECRQDPSGLGRGISFLWELGSVRPMGNTFRVGVVRSMMGVGWVRGGHRTDFVTLQGKRTTIEPTRKATGYVLAEGRVSHSRGSDRGSGV